MSCEDPLQFLEPCKSGAERVTTTHHTSKFTLLDVPFTGPVTAGSLPVTSLSIREHDKLTPSELTPYGNAPSKCTTDRCQALHIA